MEGAKGSEVSRELCLTERRRDSRPDNEEDDERRFGRSLQLDVVQAFRKLHEARRRRELASIPDGIVSSPRPHPRRGVALTARNTSGMSIETKTAVPIMVRLIASGGSACKTCPVNPVLLALRTETMTHRTSRRAKG